VLVHGAWADGSCWSAVLESLQARGRTVTVPQFPETSSCPITESDLLPTIQTPTQIIDGDHDVFVPWSNAEYLHELLPQSEIHPLDAGRYRWEQKSTAPASSTGSAASTSVSRGSQLRRTSV
jgi:hypothetical protein